MGYFEKAKAYQRNDTNCRLFLTEKLCILAHDKYRFGNKRSELISKCGHVNICHQQSDTN